MNKDCQRAQSVPTVRQMSLEHCQNSSFRFETLVQVPLLIEGLDDAVAAQGSDLIFGFQANFLFNLLALLS